MAKASMGKFTENALINIPTERPKDDNGNWIEHPTMNGYMNPVAALYESNGENKSTQITYIRNRYIDSHG